MDKQRSKGLADHVGATGRMKGWKQAHAGASQRKETTLQSLEEGRKAQKLQLRWQLARREQGRGNILLQ